MSKDGDRDVKGPLRVLKKDEDVNLTSEELMAAGQVLVEFLKAWEHRLYAVMAGLVHLPTLMRKAKVERITSQFKPNPLLLFEEDINITKANGDWHQDMNTKKRVRIGYVDFAVVVVCGNLKITTRTGVFIRMVLDGDKWLVNPHSMNRRFNPKLADDVREEADAAESEEETDGGQGTD
jgi:hypothetical protein